MLHGSKLRVYDFDGTLFRSPRPPDGWSSDDKEFFWTNSYSLKPPVVPQEPSDEWWIPDVVSSMKTDLQDRGCSVVVLTGRIEVYRIRIGQLLMNKGLLPNALFLNDTDLVSRDHKISKMLRALHLSRRGIKNIGIWECNHNDL